MDDTKNNPAFSMLDGAVMQRLAALPTPCYVICEKQLEENAKRLKAIMDDTGCKILLAQKAFSNFNFYPLLSGYLSGTEASGLYEARLGREEMPDKEVHVFCGAYREDEFAELLNYADHIARSVEKIRQKGKGPGKKHRDPDQSPMLHPGRSCHL